MGLPEPTHASDIADSVDVLQQAVRKISQMSKVTTIRGNRRPASSLPEIRNFAI